MADECTMSKRTRLRALRIRATDAVGLTVRGGIWNDYEDMPTRAELRLMNLIVGLALAAVPAILILSN